MIRLAVRGRGLVCQQASQRVTDYLEGALSRAQRHRFEAHLAGCPDCPEYLAQMRALITLAGSITPDDLTPATHSGFVSLYRQWRAGEAASGRDLS